MINFRPQKKAENEGLKVAICKETPFGKDSIGGRPKKIDNDKMKIAEDLYTCTNKPVNEICEELGVSRPTFYAFLKRQDLM